MAGPSSVARLGLSGEPIGVLEYLHCLPTKPVVSFPEALAVRRHPVAVDRGYSLVSGDDGARQGSGQVEGRRSGQDTRIQGVGMSPRFAEVSGPAVGAALAL